MLHTQRQDDVYSTTVRSAILALDREGFQSFRAELPEYDAPSKLKAVDADSFFVPDITAEGRHGEKGYFEIAQKTENEAQLARKWDLLSRIAQMKQGIFKVLVPSGHMRFTQDLMRKYQLQFEVAKL
jgi:hypothetical protein